MTECKDWRGVKEDGTNTGRGSEGGREKRCTHLREHVYRRLGKSGAQGEQGEKQQVRPGHVGLIGSFTAHWVLSWALYGNPKRTWEAEDVIWLQSWSHHSAMSRADSKWAGIDEWRPWRHWNNLMGMEECSTYSARNQDTSWKQSGQDLLLVGYVMWKEEKHGE